MHGRRRLGHEQIQQLFFSFYICKISSVVSWIFAYFHLLGIYVTLHKNLSRSLSLFPTCHSGTGTSLAPLVVAWLKFLPYWPLDNNWAEFDDGTLWDAVESTITSYWVDFELRIFCQTGKNLFLVVCCVWFCKVLTQNFQTSKSRPVLFSRFDQCLWAHVVRLPSSGASGPSVQHHEGDQSAARPAAGHALCPTGPELVRDGPTEWLT